MRRLFARLRGNRRGAVAVEFALISLFFFGAIMVALDLGIYVQQKLKLGASVEAAAMLAYTTKVTTDTSPISKYVHDYPGTTQTPNVSVSCNGGGPNVTCGDGKCSCVNSTGGFTVVTTCGATCSGSSAISGNYLKITATETYQAMVVPDSILGGSQLVQSAVVRMP